MKEVEIAVEDSDNTVDEDDKKYHEKCWPEDDPIGFSFKGKKRTFIKAFENIKVHMKKANKIELADIAFRVLDMRKINSGVEIEVEIVKKMRKELLFSSCMFQMQKKDAQFL